MMVNFEHSNIVIVQEQNNCADYVNVFSYL